MLRLSYKRFIAASPAAAWPIISDHVGYADVADNLSKVDVVRGNGLNMQRRCFDLRGRGWNETCDLWQAGQRYSFVVDTAAPDYPYPMKALRGTWGVEPAVGGCVIEMIFEITPKYGAFGRFFVGKAMKPKFDQVCQRLLDRWADRIVAASAKRAA